MKAGRGLSTIRNRASPVVSRHARSLSKPHGRLYNTKDARRNSELADPIKKVSPEASLIEDGRQLSILDGYFQ